MIAQGLATDVEVAELVAQLDEFAATPDNVATLPRTIQVTGRVPQAQLECVPSVRGGSFAERRHRDVNRGTRRHILPIRTFHNLGRLTAQQIIGDPRGHPAGTA